MILIIVTIVALTLGIIGSIYGWFGDSKYFFSGSVVVAAMSAVALVIELLGLLSVYGHLDATIQQKQVVYDALMCQVENHVYADDDFGKKELYSEITDWNTYLAKGKTMSDSAWVGVFWPDELYDRFDYIDYKRISNK